MATGYMGRVLWVDLSAGTTEIEVIPDHVYQRFLAGYGLGAWLIHDRQPAGADPLGPEAIFGVMSGLLTGTGALFAGRWMVVGKSPLTGGWGDANCGGDFAPAIKRAGVDGILFKGQAARPCYLLVDGDTITVEDAGDLWGRDAVETEDALVARHGKRFKVACVGQGGEQRALIAGVVNAGGRIAARSGLGAVMGSKNLKAICLGGKHKIKAHDPEAVKAASKAFKKRLDRDEKVDGLLSGKITGLMGRTLRRFRTQPSMPGVLFKYTLRKWGTAGITAMSAETGDSPVKNWKGAGYVDFPIKGRAAKISDDRVTKYETKKYHCYSCPLGCGGICTVPDGPHPLEETHKPEYETLCAFGALLLVDDLPLIFHLNDRLNRAGIDTISAGVTIAWAIEAFEQGMLTEADTGGLVLDWGDGEVVRQLVEQIIAGEGLGAHLKDGVQRAARWLGKGSEALAVHAGGQELPMHDARYDPGYGLAYEVEPTPGRHTIASNLYLDLMGLHTATRQLRRGKLLHGFKDRFKVQGRGAELAVASAFMDVVNGAGLCLFGVSIGGKPPVAQWLNAATGWELSFDDYLEVGRRIKSLRQAFNVREGVRPRDTHMTARARGNPPLDDGPLAGLTPDFDGLTADFYEAMGWDPETGAPTAETVARLGIEKELERP